MSSNNQIVLIGRVGNTIQENLRYVNGTAVAEVSLAVQRPGRSREGQQSVDWVRCEFWDRQADILAQYAQKGALISVSGALRIDSWQDDAGHTRKKTFVRGYQFQFLNSPRKHLQTATQDQKDQREQREILQAA